MIPDDDPKGPKHNNKWWGVLSAPIRVYLHALYLHHCNIVTVTLC